MDNMAALPPELAELLINQNASLESRLTPVITKRVSDDVIRDRFKDSGYNLEDAEELKALKDIIVKSLIDEISKSLQPKNESKSGK